MSDSDPKTDDRSPAAVRAEAAAWLARLQGPNRTPRMEAGLRRWLAESAEHRSAFERLTDAWEKSARLHRRPHEKVSRWETRGFRLSFPRAAMASFVVAAIAVIGTMAYLHTDEVVTAVGEQRTLRLDDGTRVYLNTDTAIKAHYDKRTRRVELARGEAMFEVAKRPDWPFIVVAGDQQVKALGTSFVVRRDEKGLAVTLVEGKVTVSPTMPTTAAPIVPAIDHAPSRSESSKDQRDRYGTKKDVVTLAPGERLILADNRDVQIDRPKLHELIAWQHGQVSFDSTPLTDAVVEMNRYSKVRITIDDPLIESIPISGSFRAGDSTDFARAVAKTYHLKVQDRDGEIALRAK